MQRINRIIRVGRFFGVLVPALLTLFIFGCDNDDPDKGLNKFVFVWSPKTTGNDVFKPGWEGAKARAAALTTNQIEVEVTEVADENVSVEQAGLLQTAINAGGIHGIAVSVGEEKTEGPTFNDVLNAAVTANIPVLTWDSDCSDCDRFTHYNMDNEEAAATGAEILSELIGTDGGEVAFLSWLSDSSNMVKRKNGFKNKVESISGLTLPDENIIECELDFDDTSERIPNCADKLEKLIDSKSADDNFKGVFFAAVWGNFLGEGKTVAEMQGYEGAGTGGPDGTSVPKFRVWAKDAAHYVVAIDSLPMVHGLLEANSNDEIFVDALIGQKYWGWGYDTIKILYDKVVNNQDPGDFSPSGSDIICGTNIADYKTMWNTRQFSELSACDFSQ